MNNRLSFQQIKDTLDKICSLQELIIDDFKTIIRELSLSNNMHVPVKSTINGKSASVDIFPTKLPEVLSVKDIQKYLGIGRVQAYNLVNSGRFRVVNIGRRKLIERRVFLQWLNEKP